MRIRQQARDGVSIGRVVVAADDAAAIDQHHSRAVDWTRIAALRGGELEAVPRQSIDGRLLTGQEIPTIRLRLQSRGVLAQ